MFLHPFEDNPRAHGGWMEVAVAQEGMAVCSASQCFRKVLLNKRFFNVLYVSKEG